MLEHISTEISPSDFSTKVMGLVIHSRHTMRIMGEYGSSIYALLIYYKDGGYIIHDYGLMITFKTIDHRTSKIFHVRKEERKM